MSNFSSTLQVLVIEEQTAKKVNPDTGLPNKWKVARCALLDDAGEVINVGRLRVPRDLDATIARGTFRATFALGVPDWGDSKGDIMAMLTALTPVQLRAQQIGAAAPAPAASGASKV